MKRHGKKFTEASKKVDANARYTLDKACQLVKDMKTSKFDESVDVAINLNVDPRQADQNVRSAVSLPHGTGKSLRVLVFAKGPKVKEAEDAGADVVGGDELAKKIEEGFLGFDRVVATPDMMAVVGKLGKVLGPRGLMPNPKLGSVTPDVAKAVKDVKGGKIEFKVDKNGTVHASFGKVSFTADKLSDNLKALMNAVIKVKPQTVKGAYVKKIAISSTMGPGVKLDLSQFVDTAAAE